LGDTGADTIEGSDNLERLWHAISPLMTAGKVKAIFVEVSFANARPDQLLFGHLTPRLLMDEMKRLSQLSGDGLKQCPLVITHVKPDTPSDEIKRELDQLNELGFKLIFAEQAKLLEF
jgi:3',5'-cyclic-nucleotide phosphodiesterase